MIRQTFAVVLLTGCVTVRMPTFLQEAPERSWGPTLQRAQTLASNGQAVQADSVLASFAAAYPSTHPAIETNYWRALLGLRASESSQRVSDAIPLLQGYLAAGHSTEHWMEADALLRAAARVDTLNHIAATYVSKGEVALDAAAAANARAADAKADAKAATADSKSQDEEIKRLRDELAKSKDELERIKKRLAEPPKKPPF
ncbi:MAG TPA: hypothetical protein VIV65_00320 [Gemmatimonadaceae bacterium]